MTSIGVLSVAVVIACCCSVVAVALAGWAVRVAMTRYTGPRWLPPHQITPPPAPPARDCNVAPPPPRWPPEDWPP